MQEQGTFFGIALKGYIGRYLPARPVVARRVIFVCVALIRPAVPSTSRRFPKNHAGASAQDAAILYNGKQSLLAVSD